MNVRNVSRRLGLLGLVFASAASLYAQVSFDRLVRSAQEPHNWLSYSGGYFSQRHSELTQITPGNVQSLELAWIFQLSSREPSSTRFEVTPLVVDGVLYMVAAAERHHRARRRDRTAVLDLFLQAVAAGAAVLRPRESWPRDLGETGCSWARSTGTCWRSMRRPAGCAGVKAGVRPEAGYNFTSAPLVVKDKVIVGPAGGEFGIRGFLAAFDARDRQGSVAVQYEFRVRASPGTETWDGDSWKTGGAPIWLTGSYDPELNLTYWGIGNPGPDWNGDNRTGDNLYSNSVVALDADTGKLKWHFQFTPHDEFDHDAMQVPVLADVAWQGQPRKLMFFANRNGFFYVLDRATGEFLSGTPFVQVNWASGLDANGRPIRIADKAPSAPPGTLIFPGNNGGTNWYSPSYSPRTSLFYIPTWANYSTLFVKDRADYVEGRRFSGGGSIDPVPGIRAGVFNWSKADEGYGAVRAIDPNTGALKWEYKMSDLTCAGILTTATNVLFSGGNDGYFYALDARTGTLLWRMQLGSDIRSGPMTYAVNGRQHVAVAAGSALLSFKLREQGSPALRVRPGG